MNMIDPVVDLDSLSMRQKVILLETELAKQAQVDVPIKHYFSQGIYGREMTIPADTVVTGEIHKYSQLNILSKGDISVLTEEGIKRVQAPFTIVSPPGTKRIAYAHTECIWTTIHATEETDIDKIELQFIAKDEQEYLDHCEKLLIGVN